MSWDWVTILKNLNWTFIFNIINFVLLLWLLTRFLYRPALDWLEKRRKLEEERLVRAKAREEEAQVLRVKAEEELSSANRQARELVARAEAEAQEILRQAKEEAREEARRLLKEEERVAARLREEALEELRKEYASLVVLAAAQVLGREVRPEDHQRLLSELTSRLGPGLLS